MLNRICTSYERELIAGAREPDYLLWSFWACKEAAYKALSKTCPTAFIPRQFRVRLDTRGEEDLATEFRGIIETPAGSCRVRVTRGRGYVCAVALPISSTREESEIHDQVWVLGAGDESCALRAHALRFLSSLLGCSEESLEIKRTPTPQGLAPPYLYQSGQKVDLDVSLSHDGQFGAVAVSLPYPHSTLK